MNRNEAAKRRQSPAGQPSLAIREAVGSYALAKGIEGGLNRAQDAIKRLIGEARAETHEAWALLDAALAAEALASDGEVER